MIFRKREEEPLEITLGNHKIPQKESTQFLGMTLDSRLNWEEHIEKTRAKAKRALNIIKIVAGKKWGADRKTLKKLYSAICRLKIDYGCQLYGTATKSRLKKLDSIHREGIRIYTGAFKTSPMESLHVEANEPALYKKRNELGLRFYID